MVKYLFIKCESFLLKYIFKIWSHKESDKWTNRQTDAHNLKVSSYHKQLPQRKCIIRSVVTLTIDLMTVRYIEALFNGQLTLCKI